MPFTVRGECSAKRSEAECIEPYEQIAIRKVKFLIHRADQFV